MLVLNIDSIMPYVGTYIDPIMPHVGIIVKNVIQADPCTGEKECWNTMLSYTAVF